MQFSVLLKKMAKTVITKIKAVTRNFADSWLLSYKIDIDNDIETRRLKH